MVEQINPRGLAQWLTEAQSNGQPLVLDVREPWELATASVNPLGFELLAIPMSALGARWQELDRERPIACLCHHGGRSMQVAHFLTQQGFRQVANIAGGIDAWSQDLDPDVPRY